MKDPLFCGLAIMVIMSVSGFRLEAESVRLRDGTVLVGEVSREGDAVVVDTAVFGRLTVPVSMLADATQAMDAAPSALTSGPVSPAAVELEAGVSSSATVRWSGDFTATLSHYSAFSKYAGANTSYRLGGRLRRDALTYATTLAGSYTFSETDVYRPATQDLGPLTLIDTWDASIVFERPFNDRWVGILRSGYYVNEMLTIGHYWENLAGAGYWLAKSERFSLMVAPGFAYFDVDVASFGQGSTRDFGLGLFQEVRIRLLPALYAEGRIIYVRAVGDDAYFYDGYVGLTGMITRTLGLQIGLSFKHYSVIPEPFEPSSQLLTSGIQLKF
jgi:hypothetical protein